MAVVTIYTDGTAATLRRRDGLNLGDHGPLDVERSSEVVWSYMHQSWYISFTSGRYAGCSLTLDMVSYVGLDVTTLLEKTEGEVLYFQYYEDAVYVEHEIQDRFRSIGKNLAAL